MAKARISAKDPFDVQLTAEKRKDLADWLSTEIESAYNARVNIIGPYGDIDYSHHLYEQGKSQTNSLRWPGAADLTSWIVTEKVDSLRARIVRTIFSEPVFIIDGWGADAKKSAYAEEFHQWQVEATRLQQYLSKVVHNALIEQTGVLEVVDRAESRLIRRTLQAAAKKTADGLMLLDDKNQPIPDRDERGALKQAVEGEEVIDVASESYQTVRKGPGYRVISLRDFLFLPGHVADKADLFGRAKRCWLRTAQLTERVKQGWYDKETVEKMGGESDRTEVPQGLQRTGVSLAEQTGRTVEKEVWEVQLLHDLDDDGLEEWYLATVSVQHRELLRLKRDDLGYERYIDFTPFPRSNSLYGYSYVLDKMGTIAEEHTSIRNMIADRSQLATNPPIKRVTGSLWNPQEQPFGTASVIDVRDPNEVQAMVIPDVPASAVQREAVVLQAAERVTGLNDTAVGVNTQEKRTLGEVQIVEMGGAVRTEEVIKNLQESMEILWCVINECWIRTLREMPQGLEAPERIARSIETKQLQLQDGRFTASMLMGNLRGKPRQSVETADKNRMRQDFNQSLQALVGFAKLFPMAQLIFQNPEVLKSLMEQWARLYNVPDMQPYIKALSVPPQQPGMGMLGPGQPQPGAEGQPPQGGQPNPAQIQQLLAQMPEEQLAQLEQMVAQGGVQ
jgi:hypothetical protein